VSDYTNGRAKVEDKEGRFYDINLDGIPINYYGRPIIF
jgi:hypothetical protein